MPLVSESTAKQNEILGSNERIGSGPLYFYPFFLFNT